jgi:hypothetical protein
MFARTSSGDRPKPRRRWFLETQLPALKTQVDSAEAAYNNYRQSRGSLDLSLETQGILKSLVDVENAAVLLKQERDELRQNFTPEHPRIQAVDSKLRASTNAASSLMSMSHACPIPSRPFCAWRVTSKSRTGCTPSC